MISEKDKQKILNGAYGITRNGFKCKYIGTNTLQRYVFAFFNDKGEILHIIDMLGKFNRFKHTEEGEFDVVGLWKDKPEPFDLERALASEPVMTRDGSKAYIVGQYWQPEGLEAYCLIGYGFNGDAREFMHWHDDGKVMADDDSCDDIIGMWKESETVSNTVTVTLPRMLKEPQDNMWYLTGTGVVKSVHDMNIPSDTFDNRPYFGSKEDAQAWFKAMQDSCS